MNEHSRKAVISSLLQEMSGRGIKNVELAELTGWSTSKISKMLSGKQGFTDEDLRVWARALGYTLDPFADQGVGLRGYDVREFVRSPMECISDFMEGDEDDPRFAATLNIELPLSILGSLGVRASDYSVRTHLSEGYHGEEEQQCSWIKIWNRNIKDQEQSQPVLSIWIDSNRDRFAVIVYLDGESNDLLQEVAEIRIEMKGIHNGIDFLVKEDAHDHWMPECIVDRTISFDYWGKDSPWPDDDFFQESLAEVFKDYCDVIWELRHIDLIPDVAIFGNPNTPVQMALMKAMVRDSSFAEETINTVLSSREYRCEIDPTHETFQTPAGHQYAEAVPLIPFENLYLGKGLMDGANVLCLCPNCAAKLQYGTDEDREEMLIGLYRSHKKSLENAGVTITLGQLLKTHKL